MPGAPPDVRACLCHEPDDPRRSRLPCLPEYGQRLPPVPLSRWPSAASSSASAPAPHRPAPAPSPTCRCRTRRAPPVSTTRTSPSRRSAPRSACPAGRRRCARPRSYTNGLKAQGIIDYGYSDTNMSDYEEDHHDPPRTGRFPAGPAEPVAGAALGHQELHHQGRRGDETEERRLQGHHHAFRRPQRDQGQLDHGPQRHRHRLAGDRPSAETFRPPRGTHRGGRNPAGANGSQQPLPPCRRHGPVIASMMPGVWMLANSVSPSGEKVTPVNSLYSGSCSVPMLSSLRASG